MWEFRKLGTVDGPGRSQNQPTQELESYCWHPCKNVDHQSCSDDDSRGAYSSAQASDQHCTRNASTGAGDIPIYNSASTVSFSSNGSPLSQPDSHSYPSETHPSPDDVLVSSVSRTCMADNVTDLGHKLRELETVMLGPDSDLLDAYATSNLGVRSQISSEMGNWQEPMKLIGSRELKEVLIACAKAIADNDLLTTEWLMSELRLMVSVSGEPVQRLGAYMLEGLVARLASSGSSIYKALRCKEPASSELLSYMHILYEVCPYFKFGYLSANGAIAEAMKDENRIHIIDFQIAQGSQWVTLIQALAARPGGPPKIRITGIDDATSAYARGGGLNIVGQRLSRLAESCKVPFEFNVAAISPSEVEIGCLGVQSGEALAVNFALMLHHMPDENVGTQNHRDRLLRLVKRLSPKVVTLVEQESNTNALPFLPRFFEALNYYMAIFESIDVTLPREHKERINVEQHCLAREIVNIIACEGAERVERHELFKKWRSRFLVAGFAPYPLSPFINSTIKTLLENYSQKYTLKQKDGALYLGWMNQDLVVSCAWN